MKRIYSRLVAAGLTLGMLVAPLENNQFNKAEAAVKAKVSSVKITNVKKNKLVLKKGKTFALKTKVKVKPNKAKYKKVSFKTSNKKVVTINKKGKLKALKKGKAKVTVQSKINKKKKAVIRVVITEDAKGGKQNNVLTTPSFDPQAGAVPTQAASASPTQNIKPTSSPKVTPVPTPTPIPTQEPDGTSTLMRKPFAEQANVGAALSDVMIRSGVIVDSNGNAIEGTYQWEEPATLLSSDGKTHHKAKFVPKNNKFSIVEHISIPVITIKNKLTLTKPTASSLKTGMKLSSSILSGGSAKDRTGNAVKGSFSWVDDSLFSNKPGKFSYAAVFTPEDTTKYRTEMIYIKVTVVGDEIPDQIEKKALDLTGGKWKNDEAYVGQWQGTFYDVTPYLKGIDMSKYTKLTVEAEVYDSSNRPLTNANQNYIGFKLANQKGDWWGFADAYVNKKASLSLSGYDGKELYLVAQNMSAAAAYIEIKSITLETGSSTNINDGSSLKLAFGDIFGKVGSCLSGFQVNNKDCTNFLKSQFNSVTMGNEMKPDALLNSELSDKNPDGYVDTSTFTNKYMDTKYPKINLQSIDRYMEMAYSNGIKMRFHVFVWHKQSPKWFFKKNFDENQGWVSPEVMSGRLEYYVRNVMEHIFNYKNADGVYIGRAVIDNWDMANEYTHNCDGDEKSYWDEVFYPEYKFQKDKHSGFMKPVYIKKAFAIGHSIVEKYQLTDKISLIYNDYNTYQEADNIVKMIQYFNTKDDDNPNAEIICDGVGTQMHLDLTFPTVKSIETNCINKFMEAGFEIQPTEMDLTDEAKTEASQEKQIKYWYNLLMTLMVKKDSGAKITGVVWWGLGDDTSWRREDVPLLFSKNWMAKDHYYNVIDAVSWYNMGDSSLQM